MTEKTTPISTIPIYKQLSATGQKLLDAKTLYVDCKSSDTIIIQGQKASGAYIVLEGQLRVYSVSPKGNQATMYTIDPGETCVLALNCLFNDLVYPAWVYAEVNSKVAVIPGPAFRSLFAYEPSIQDLTVRTLSTLVFRLMDELGDVHGLSHSQRLAGFLLTRASESGELNMTQQQIADHLGTRREVVARLLLEFVDNRWIKTGRGKITVLNIEQLRAITQA